MSILITSDLHLTDRDRDEYRWGLFPWIAEQIDKHEVSTLLFLGDTCNKGLGLFYDSSLNLRKAADYIDNYATN